MDAMCVALLGSEENRRGAEKKEGLAWLLGELRLTPYISRGESRLLRPQSRQHHTHCKSKQCDWNRRHRRVGSQSCIFRRRRSFPLREQLCCGHMCRWIVEGELISNAPRENSQCKHRDSNYHPMRATPSCLLRVHKFKEWVNL
jgi:hypothetical protein